MYGGLHRKAWTRAGLQRRGRRAPSPSSQQRVSSTATLTVNPRPGFSPFRDILLPITRPFFERTTSDPPKTTQRKGLHNPHPHSAARGARTSEDVDQLLYLQTHGLTWQVIGCTPLATLSRWAARTFRSDDPKSIVTTQSR